MAIRIQLRRDTAANWISSNPVLRQGEMGIETDTLKIKLGDGTSTWTQITAYMNLVPDGNSTIGDYVMVTDIGAAQGVVGLDNNKNAIVTGSSIILEGATDNAYETTLTVTDPTADRTITFKNSDGTVAFVTDIPSNTDALTEGSTNKYFSDERAQDAVANALAAGSHTNITVTYNDTANSLSIAAAPGYTDEQAQDAVAAALAAGTHTNISVSYNDAGNAISLTGAQTYNDENAQDAIGNSLGGGLSYNDTTGAISVDTTTIQARVANVTDTEIGYLDGVTSAIQTQIDSKASSASPTFTGTATLGGTGDFVLNGTTNIRIVPASGSNAYVGTASADNIIATVAGLNLKAPLASPTFTGVPSAPTAVSSTNTTQIATTAYVKAVVSDLTNGAGAAYDTLKELQDLIVADEGAVSSLTTLVGTKAPLASPTFTGTVSGINKTMVGLGNIDNTTDAGKPISTATQTALDLKLASATAASTYAPIASPTFTGTVTIPTGSIITSPVISTITNTGTLTLPTTTGTLALTSQLVASAAPGTEGKLYGYSNSTAASKTTVGYQAGNASSSNITAIGYQAGLLSTATNNVAIGYQAFTAGTTGDNNVAIGFEALKSVTSTYGHTAVGYRALATNFNAAGNTAVGSYAGQANISGDITAIGSSALTSNTTGSSNTAIGSNSLAANTTNSNSTAVGYFALRFSTGSFNSALGMNAGYAITTGGGNTIFGAQAGNGATAITTGSGNIIIGYLANASSATVSNEITLGSSSITTFRIPGLSISATTTALTVPSLTPTNAIGAIYGGTGFSTYATGDILYSSATNTLSKLTAGSNGQILTLAAGVPTWAAAPITLPTQTSNAGKYLTTDGTSASWGTLVVPITTGTTTVSANTATTVDTTALSAFTSIEYMISLKQGSKIRTSKVVVQNDGTSVDMTEFAITETGGTIAGVVISATTASTNAVLQLTVTDAATTNVTVKFSKVAL